MKTKLLMVALLASAALIAPVYGGGLHGAGGGSFAASGPGVARGGGGLAVHSAPMPNVGGGRMIYSGQRFSSVGPRSQGSMVFRPHYVNSNAGASTHAHQFTRGNSNRVNEIARFSNRGNRTITNGQHVRNGAGQIRNGNNTLRSDWRNHVFAQHSANWHRDWDRHHDHFFHGHRFVFIDGFWFGFDFGFDPWWPWYYPYDYYAYGYPYPYAYGYDPGYYDSGAYYDEGGYVDQAVDSTIAAAQQRLARDGYYRGAIDGIAGPETRRAIARYQSNHGLRVTGALTSETLATLGLRQVASY